jgi:dihydroorotate dehydrogenase electron transfer subunit
LIYDLECKIIENRFISGKTCILKVEAPEIAKNTKAGQFVMVKPTLENYYDPLLRRAFAIADVEGDTITLFYDVYGKGTKFIAKRKEGDYINVLGPLGNNLFPENYDNYIVVGGGIGFAGVSLFLKEIKKQGKKFVAIYGARKKEDLSMIDWINENGIDVLYYTDDGSFGKKGLVTQDLDSIIEQNKDAALIVCGPKSMMKAVSKIAISKNMPCYLSLESRMACGIGICVGCVVKDTTKDTYVRVCYEGPVFEVKEIELS